MSSKIQIPFPSFYDIDGRPLDAGYVYLGEVGKNPEVYPVSAFWDESLTVPAAQPVRTRNGYFSKNGKPGKLFVGQMSCSITIKNKKGLVIYTDLHSDLSFNQKYFINTVGTIAELQDAEVWDGRIVFVKEYNANTGVGGDFFKYDATKSGINDYGYVINGWTRQRQYDDVDVTHFGAIPDDVTDCMDPCKRMFFWQLAVDDKLGIRFPKGNFAISNWDDSSNFRWNFIVRGAGNLFGYMNKTNLRLINGNGTHVFKVQARYTDIENIKVLGGAASEANTRNFFKNTITAGQFIRMSCIQVSALGGKGFDFQDTLDFKIDQFYAEDCYDNVLSATMSGDPNGAWTHSTAIDISNVNIQRHKGSTAARCALFLPRCMQSSMKHIWIESSTWPMNISEGDWIIDSLNVERCDNPVLAQYLKYDVRQQNVLTVFDFNNGEIGNYNGVTRPSWVTSEFEQGGLQIQPQGVDLNTTFSAKFVTPKYRFSGNSIWLKIGTYVIPNLGETVDIELQGLSGWDSVDNPINDVNNTRQGGGKAVVSIQKKGNVSGRATWYGEGVCPITDVRIATPYENDTTVYVKLASFVNALGIFNRTNSMGRLQTGTPIVFRKDMIEVSQTEATTGTVQPPSVKTFTNRQYGFGMDLTNGRLIVNAPVSANKIPIYVNGVLKYISYTDS
ncbi:hypothetical protein [Acinetobacter soli]|uniref:hypothetical protein n=1 Tax=Acinetobacter soli TaxID=487316 RepID=UPI001250444C|nr:hypothetical protein [Acinetobacter soli]